jgi:methionyl-tRNA synthetase
LLAYLGQEEARWSSLGNFNGIRTIAKPDYLFTKLEDELVETLRTRYAGSQESRKEERQRMEQQETKTESAAQVFADKVTLKVSKIVDVQQHPGGDKLYILQVDTGAEEPTTIVSSIVPYYTAQELLGRNIVLVQNLKPANFRGVKSRGMLLAASDPAAEPHTTCEVLFADQFPVGAELNPEGTNIPAESRSQLKADLFFSLPLKTVGGHVMIDGHPVAYQGTPLVATTYPDGDVG